MGLEPGVGETTVREDLDRLQTAIDVFHHCGQNFRIDYRFSRQQKRMLRVGVFPQQSDTVNHARHGKHCPWCSYGRAGYALIMVLLSVPQLAVSLRTGWSWPVRTLLAVALFPAGGAVVALGFGWWNGYWRP